MLGRRIAAHQPPSTCLPELRRALLDEWCNIPEDQIDNLILSMPRRSGRFAPGTKAREPNKSPDLSPCQSQSTSNAHSDHFGVDKSSGAEQ
ncbi:transposable element Tcb1 transposase [Trichonephila clavipes]|nr:transposable element Tcb1 transposase [Trichonephila clavipes]